MFGAELHVSGRDRDALLTAVRNAAGAHEIVETETGLEDAFIHLMNQAQDNFQPSP